MPKLLQNNLNLRMLHRARLSPGERPGLNPERIQRMEAKPSCQIDVTDYGKAGYDHRTELSLDEALAMPPQAAGMNRWIQVRGLDPTVVSALCMKFGVHTLHAEDAVNVPQRPRLETADNYDFIATRILMIGDDGNLRAEQLCMALLDDTLITFEEADERMWHKIRERMQMPDSRIRAAKPDYLAYALLDFAVDHAFPITEDYLDKLGVLERQILDQPTSGCIHALYEMQHNLLTLKRVVTPMRDLAEALCRGSVASPRIYDSSVPFFTDVSHHAIQLGDVIDGCREMAVSLSDLYQSSVSNQANQVMKLLTLMAALFIPITFLAGVYGMNFEHIPELQFKYSYPIFWTLCILIVSSLLVYFKKKRWLE